MGRPVDVDSRDKIREFLKMEYLKAGGPVELTFKEIAEAVGMESSKVEKIYRLVNKLEKSGVLKIHRGVGSRPNKYEYISDYVLPTKKNSVPIEIDDLAKGFNESLNKLLMRVASLQEENMSLKGEVEYYRGLLGILMPFGHAADGKTLFKNTGSTNAIAGIIEEAHKERMAKIKENINTLPAHPSMDTDENIQDDDYNDEPNS